MQNKVRWQYHHGKYVPFMFEQHDNLWSWRHWRSSFCNDGIPHHCPDASEGMRAFQNAIRLGYLVEPKKSF